MFQDKTLNCRECGIEFVFTASEQEFFAEKGFTNDPGRCPACRRARKERNGNLNRTNSNYSQRQMYEVTCADCGIQTEVPFKPSNDRPVYCRECFNKHKNQ